MDKEIIKRIICDYIDSAEEVLDFSISNEVEEIDRSTLEGKNIIRNMTGVSNVYITTYRGD